MPVIKARYPLLIIAIASIIYLIITTPLAPEGPSTMQAIPELNSGYYLVLNTHAKLPNETPHIHSKNVTYIGPLSTIAECHNQRTQVKPIYPGIELNYIKVNQL